MIKVTIYKTVNYTLNYLRKGHGKDQVVRTNLHLFTYFKNNNSYKIKIKYYTFLVTIDEEICSEYMNIREGERRNNSQRGRR